jgi:hypothetical protein
VQKNITCSTNCKQRTAAYTINTVYFKYIIVNTIHNGDNKYNNNNNEDIIIKNKKEKLCILIDVAIPADRNVMQKEAEKQLKYKSLCIEIQQMWNMKCMIIPLTTGANDVVTKGLRKYLEATSGKHSTDLLQKTATLGTSHIIRKVLHSET